MIHLKMDNPPPIIGGNYFMLDPRHRTTESDGTPALVYVWVFIHNDTVHYQVGTSGCGLPMAELVHKYHYADMACWSERIAPVEHRDPANWIANDYR